MRGLILSAVTSFIIMTGGCSWPPSGKGGMDEAFTYSRQAAVSPMDLPDVKELAQRLDAAKASINALTVNGAMDIAPARLELLNRQWTRAAREFAGTFWIDCNYHLKQAEQHIKDLKQVLETWRQAHPPSSPVTEELST